MSLYLDKRTKVWYERERTADGRRTATRLGPVSDLPTKADAERALRSLSSKWTEEPAVSAIVERYLAEGDWDRATTYCSCTGKLRNHILPRWGAAKLSELRPMDLDTWFRSLNMAPTTKAGIKTLFSQVWQFAALHELVSAQQNPLELVRIKGSSRRRRRPQILTPEEIRRLIDNIIVEPYRLMVIVTACLGLRRSELSGLQWGDFNWIDNTVMISRGVVDNNIGEVKTESSEKPLPLDPALVLLLQSWRNTTLYKEENDWVWGSPLKGGSLPYYPNAIQKTYIRPAGIRAGLGEHVGFHALRHAYRSLLASSGASLTVQKDLLRHSNIATTANVYGGALPEDQRTANSAVVRMLIQ